MGQEILDEINIYLNTELKDIIMKANISIAAKIFILDAIVEELDKAQNSLDNQENI